MLNTPDAYKAIDAMLTVSTQESEIDAFWLNEIMGWLPFTKRDAFWCGYLKLGYEENDIVRRIIEAAKDIDLQRLMPRPLNVGALSSFGSTQQLIAELRTPRPGPQ